MKHRWLNFLMRVRDRINVTLRNSQRDLIRENRLRNRGCP
jgi:hypothetical protein